MTSPLAQRAHHVCQMTTDVPSPCMSICEMDGNPDRSRSLCRGCYRTLAEIARWSQLSEPEKRSIWQQLPGRQQVFGL